MLHWIIYFIYSEIRVYILTFVTKMLPNEPIHHPLHHAERMSSHAYPSSTRKTSSWTREKRVLTQLFYPYDPCVYVKDKNVVKSLYWIFYISTVESTDKSEFTIKGIIIIIIWIISTKNENREHWEDRPFLPFNGRDFRFCSDESFYLMDAYSIP